MRPTRWCTRFDRVATAKSSELALCYFPNLKIRRMSTYFKRVVANAASGPRSCDCSVALFACICNCGSSRRLVVTDTPHRATAAHPTAELEASYATTTATQRDSHEAAIRTLRDLIIYISFLSPLASRIVQEPADVRYGNLPAARMTSAPL